MLIVEPVGKLRRAYFSQGKPIKEICRDLHVPGKSFRKVIRSDATRVPLRTIAAASCQNRAMARSPGRSARRERRQAGP
jgi:hypothetical protein